MNVLAIFFDPMGRRATVKIMTRLVSGMKNTNSSRSDLAIAVPIVIVVLLGGNCYFASAFANDKLQALARAFGAGEVLGRFTSRGSDNVIFQPHSRRYAVVRIANKLKVQKDILGLPLAIRGRLDKEKRALFVSSYRYQPASRRSKGESKGFSVTTYDPTKPCNFGQVDSQTKLDVNLDGKSAELFGAIGDQFSNLMKCYMHQLKTGDGDHLARNDIFQSIVDLIRNSEGNVAIMRELNTRRGFRKSVYTAPDDYAPWSYEEIFKKSATVVAIAVPDSGQVECSGFLIESNLVLTVARCFANYHPTDLEVWAGYAENADGSSHKPQKARINTIVAPDQSLHAELMDSLSDLDIEAPHLLDYVIVQISDSLNLPISGPVQCSAKFTAASNRAGAPIYVVGHPKGARAKIHDSGRTLYPYQIEERWLGDTILNAEIVLSEGPVELSDPEFRSEAITDLYSSYSPQGYRPPKSISASASTEGFLEFLDSFGSVNKPRFGIELDTNVGNSGSPVYHRRSNKLLGLFVSGQNDEPSGFRGVSRLEQVLPISAIYKHLRSYASTQQYAKLLDPARSGCQ